MSEKEKQTLDEISKAVSVHQGCFKRQGVRTKI